MNSPQGSVVVEIAWCPLRGNLFSSGSAPTKTRTGMLMAPLYGWLSGTESETYKQAIADAIRLRKTSHIDAAIMESGGIRPKLARLSTPGTTRMLNHSRKWWYHANPDAGDVTLGIERSYRPLTEMSGLFILCPN